MDYYKVLGVSKDADTSVIKKKYRQLALKWHPDKAPADKKKEYEEEFKDIANAYGILSDSEKRKQYDQFGEDGNMPTRQGFSGGKGTSFHFSSSRGTDPRELFTQMFGSDNPFRENSQTGGHPFASMNSNHGSRFQQQSRGPPVTRKKTKGKKIDYKLTITLENAFTGLTKTLKISDKDNLSKNIEIKIPQGVENNKSFIIPNCIYAGGEYLPSDLNVIIEIKPHGIFTRDDCDLHMKINVMYDEVVEGIYRELTMIDNSKQVVNIKKIKESNHVHKINGMGLHKQNGDRGDVCIHFNVKF
jgi:DnaJ family protein B protein 4